MSEPLNEVTLNRIRALIDLVERVNDPGAECSVWASDDYVHVEVRSSKLPINEVRLALNAAPLELDQVREIEERKRIAREVSMRRNFDDL